MTATEEPTLYDVLEVDPASSIDELREAVERARETFGTESLAVYALVDEEQLGELRAKLDQAAEVLLDPARRATYDRSIGRIGPATLWAEDDDEDDPPLPPVEPGPHARAASLEVEDEADDADDAEEEEEEEEEVSPRQQALALEVTEAPGPFGRTAGEAARSASQPAGLLTGDWAAAVPGQHAARHEPVVPPARTQPERAREEPPLETVSAPAREDVPERTGLPPSLGLRVKPPAQAPGVEPEVPEPAPAAIPAPPATSIATERAPEHPTGSRAGKLRLDIPADAEFNGELLRRVRESYGLSLQQVAERTRITRIHLENVEADRYDRLPATVYLRGILVNLARELRLDPARVSKTYLLAAQRAHARGS